MMDNETSLPSPSPAPLAAKRMCRNHDGTPARAFCQQCGIPLCGECVHSSVVRQGPFCADCVARVEDEWTRRQHQGPAPTALGARCAFHADRAAAETCSRCGTFLCSTCSIPSPWEDEKTYCSECLQRLEAEGGGGRIPWEDRKEMFLTRYWKTVGQVLTAPGEFFRRMPARGYVPAITFQYNSMVYFVPVTILITWLTISRMLGMPQLVNRMMGTVVLAMVMTALIYPILQFVTSGWLHVHLYLFGGRRGFEPTYRMSSYLAALSFPYMLLQLLATATGSRVLMGVLLIAFAVLSLSVMTIAAARVQRMSAGLAFLGILLFAVEVFLLWYYLIMPLSQQGRQFGGNPFL